MLQVKETGFDGLFLIQPQVFPDMRGSFYESWRLGDYRELGIKETFFQDNISNSKKNVLRGLHYRKDQGQLVTIIYGQVFDVVVDIRPQSKTYKKYFSITLDASEPQQLYMPPGFAHGFCVLSDYAVLHYKCSQYYDPAQEDGIIWNDHEIGIEWPLNDFSISERDRLFKTLKEMIW